MTDFKPVATVSRFLPETPRFARYPESGKTGVLEHVFTPIQGMQLLLNAIRCLGGGILNAVNRYPKRGVDYAFNTLGAPCNGERFVPLISNGNKERRLALKKEDLAEFSTC